VAVEVDDPEVAAVQVRRDAAGRRVADGVVPAEHHGEGARRVDVADGLADLVERLLDVVRDREDAAQIGDRDGLPQVDAQLEAVRAVDQAPRRRTGTEP
jgi:hypothetical protein